MKNFSDGKNQWSIDINVGSIKRVLAATKINLSLPHEPDADGQTLADRLIRDTITQVDVIWALVEPQATAIIQLSSDEDELSEEKRRVVRMNKFCEMCSPEIMKEAEAALLEEWTDFFQKLGRQPTADAIKQTRTLQASMQEHGVKQLERLRDAQGAVMQKVLTDEVDKVLQLADAAMNGKSSESAIASPGASALATSTI